MDCLYYVVFLRVWSTVSMQHVANSLLQYQCICLFAWPESLHKAFALSGLSQSTTDTSVADTSVADTSVAGLDCFAWDWVKNRCRSTVALALLSGFGQLARLALPKLPSPC